MRQPLSPESRRPAQLSFSTESSPRSLINLEAQGELTGGSGHDTCITEMDIQNSHPETGGDRTFRVSVTNSAKQTKEKVTVGNARCAIYYMNANYFVHSSQ